MLATKPRVTREELEQVALRLRFCLSPEREVAERLAERGILERLGWAYRFTEYGRRVYGRMTR